MVLVVPLAEVHTLRALRPGGDALSDAKSKPFRTGLERLREPVETNLVLILGEAEAVGDLERDGSPRSPCRCRSFNLHSGARRWSPFSQREGRLAGGHGQVRVRRIRRRHGGCLGSLAHIRRRSGTEQVYRRGTPAGRTLPASTGPRARGCTSAWARASRPCSRFDGTSAG